jgi:hypothetical protein
MAGIGNLAEMPVNLITNTVLCDSNYHGIIPLMNLLGTIPVNEMHLWNFFPMEKTDRRDQLVSMSSLLSLLSDIIPIVTSFGNCLVLKGFPECLSPGPPCFFDNDFPFNIIQDDFWATFADNGFGTCLYKDDCSAKGCWGLSSAYIEKFGDERALLSPFSKATLQREAPLYE